MLSAQRRPDKYAGHAHRLAADAHDHRNGDGAISRPNKRAPTRLMVGVASCRETTGASVDPVVMGVSRYGLLAAGCSTERVARGKRTRLISSRRLSRPICGPLPEPGCSRMRGAEPGAMADKAHGRQAPLTGTMGCPGGCDRRAMARMSSWGAHGTLLCASRIPVMTTSRIVTASMRARRSQRRARSRRVGARGW